MNADMQRILDDYLGRLRRSMRGAPLHLVQEAEREIQAHIEDALAARDQPAVGLLLDVLERLGPPEEYGRDLALYMMVDRGYRQWSLPDMFRSTAYWALGTIAGAVVVFIFAILFLGAVALVVLGLFDPVVQRLEVWAGVGQSPANSPSGLLLVAGGVLALLGLTALVRMFVGQYVRSARPHVLAGEDADVGWVERTSRRILTVAALGLITNVLAGWGSGAYRLDGSGLPHLPPDFGRSPLAWLSGLALAVLLFAPAIGLVWTDWAEARRAAEPASADSDLT